MTLAATGAEVMERLAPAPSAKSSPELIAVLVAVGIIVLLIVGWAVFFRRKPDNLSGWGPERSSHDYKREGAAGTHPRRRKWRRRRREHRPRNPTLAETGGMPPPRPDSSPDQAP